MHQHRRLFVVLASVAAVGVGLALVLSLYCGEQVEHEDEWVKALLQAGLIATLGAVTSGVLESVKDTIQQRRDESRLRFDALTDLGRIYMDVKLVRRAAQATGTLSPDQVSELNERQVMLELLKANANQFPGATGLGDGLGRMERYLNRAANKPSSEERRGFLDEGFRSFADAYKESAALMRAEISTQGVVPAAK